MIEDIFEQGLEDEKEIEGLLKNYKKYASRITTLISAINNVKKYSCLDAPISNYDPMPGKTGMKTCAMEQHVCDEDETITNFEVKKKEYENEISRIDKLIKILNPRNQRIIRDFYIEEIKLPEIADNEGYELRTIKVAKKNSLKKLQIELNNQNRLIFTLNLHQNCLKQVKKHDII
jgi:hypothetical protein